MRNLICILCVLMLSIGWASAQTDFSEYSGKKALKAATRGLSAYSLDQTNGGDKLMEAKAAIMHASKQEDINADPKVWVTMGEIYNSFPGYNQTQKVVNPEHVDVEPNSGMVAYQAYKKALTLAPGNKTALKGLSSTIGAINNTGITAYENGSFSQAFNALRSVLDIHKILKENEAESPLDVEAEHDNQLYITGLSAMSAGENATAKAYMQKLFDKKYDKPAVADAMYKLTVDEDEAAAEKILTEARIQYPDDVGLLFTEINHYLRLEKIDVLEEKLKVAIEKEPENPSLHSTLGNVYDKLYQESFKAGDFAQSEEYYASARDYYESAIKIKPDYTDAIYSIGALVYNKAAIVTQEMNELANDYSKEGTEKYNKKKIEVEQLFEDALPWFKKVETLDPSDRNTLIALKEIFARKNDFETSNEFKSRLEKIEAGETIDKSFFQD